jgi:hypothetical protein
VKLFRWWLASWNAMTLLGKITLVAVEVAAWTVVGLSLSGVI